MAQTPISATAVYNSSTPTTIYTVPAGRTAVVKGVLATSVVSTFDQVTLNKVSGGATYPIVINAYTGWDIATSSYYYERENKAVNLLSSPITLGAGDSISISTAGTPYYKAELVLNSSTYKITNITYLNGYYVVLGNDTADASGLILTSTDGITYTRRTTSFIGTFSNATFGNGYYVVCNTTGASIHYSTDLVTWTSVSLPTTSPSYAITYGGGKFVVGGDSGVSWYATSTPLSWTAATVYSSDNINAIAYIGTDYFYGTAGTSYYTADFTTFTQNYKPATTLTYSLAASSDKVLSTTANAPTSAPNTFLRRSSSGVTWAAQSTVANSIAFQSFPLYSPNGGYLIYTYYQNPGDPLRVLTSGDGITWATQSLTYLNYGQVGFQSYVPFYAATNASYNNKILGYNQGNPNDGNPSSYYINVSNISTAGVMSTNSFNGTPMSNFSSSWTLNYTPVLIANGFDGTWKALPYYTDGGANTAASYYGTTTGLTSTTGAVSYSGTGGVGYVVSGGTISGSAVYLAGTSIGGILRASNSSSGFTVPPWFGNQAHYGSGTNPPGLIWSLVSGTAVCGFAKSGNTSTSINVIVWANGVVAASSNQGDSWTMTKSPFASISTQNALHNAQPIAFGNGLFYLIDSNGQVATSADGITWTTNARAVQSIYNLNSQNVFLGQDKIFTSTGVTTFTKRELPSSSYASRATNRMVYISSTYYLFDSSNLYSTSDLITWGTGRSFSSSTINNLTYITASHYGVSYSGSGTTAAIASAYLNSVSSSSGKVAKPVTLSSSLFCGNATASIVEIS